MRIQFCMAGLLFFSAALLVSGCGEEFDGYSTDESFESEVFDDSEMVEKRRRGPVRSGFSSISVEPQSTGRDTESRALCGGTILCCNHHNCFDILCVASGRMCHAGCPEGTELREAGCQWFTEESEARETAE